MSSIDLTVITVNYNRRQDLLRTVESVVSQQGVVLEYLVVDGGSTDDSISALGPLRGAIHKLICEPDRGIYDAMNKGLAAATGRYVLFMNAGDRFLGPLSASAALVALAEQGWPDVLYLEALGDDGGQTSTTQRPAALRSESVGNHQATLIRRELHQEFLHDLRYRIKGDRDAQLRMLLSGARLAAAPMPIAAVDAGGVSRRAIWRKELENIQITYRNGCGVADNVRSIAFGAARCVAFSLAGALGVDWAGLKALLRGRPRSETVVPLVSPEHAGPAL